MCPDRNLLLRFPTLRGRLALVCLVAGLSACGTNESAGGGGQTVIIGADAAGDALVDEGAPDGTNDDIVEPPDSTSPGDGGPGETICDDGIDNDRNGNTDCADPACLEDPACVEFASTEFNCVDGIDNDRNGLVDCDDPACQASPVCRDVVGPPDPGPDAGADAEDAPEADTTEPPDGGPLPDGGAPPGPETICDDGIDNDGDGQTDCDDRDCEFNPACVASGGVPPIPFEFQCDDGLDNDGDGLIDCDDDNCNFIPPCLGGGGGGGGGVPPIPFEFQCGDGVDNDADGRIDCDDPDCRFIPPCLRF